ncbi:MAG TPA: hypothetical protein VKX49_06375 [Bryobacteraceae bacterium]|nr:hypothetical protein [Bryobacteraceae bacterium]
MDGRYRCRQRFKTLLLHFPAQRAHILNSAPNLIQGAVAFWDDPSHGLIMLSDDDFFAARNALEQFAEPGLGVKGGNGAHN